jgi:cyclopropane fatty-acyl-phospholipid synthase-like methyltransferase
MASEPAIDRLPLPSLSAQGAGVWDRLWRHAPSAEKDETLLARERAGHRWREIRRQIEGTFGTVRGLRTIELGAGRGDLSVILAECGAEVTLLDASERAHRQARERFDRLGLDANYVTADMLGSLDEQAGRFDLAVSSGVVEHFEGEQRARALAGHHAALRPGGMAVVSVPHAWCLPYRLWKLYLETRGWWPYGMEIPYSQGELSRRAMDAGFGRVEVSAYGLWQSVGDHWLKSIFHRKVDLSLKRSRVDNWLGMTALCFAWRTRSETAGR